MDELEYALARFHRLAPEWGGGFSTHGPMACEALEALGHPALIPAMADRYAPRVPDLPEGGPLTEGEMGSELGNGERVGDWIATFSQKLRKASSWRSVLGEALPLLADGAFAAAGHGLLRVGHALRALDAGDHPIRREELAHGLGYWAASFTRLPGEAGGEGRGGFESSLALLATPEHFDTGRAFTDSVADLGEDPTYLEAVARPGLSSENWLHQTHEICAAAIPFYRRAQVSRIAATHAITIPAGLQFFSGLVDDETGGRLLASAWQATLALCRLVPDLGDTFDPEVLGLAEHPDELRYRAACSLDEHAIKLAEACIRQARLGSSRAFMEVAADAAIHCGTDGARVC